MKGDQNAPLETELRHIWAVRTLAYHSTTTVESKRLYSTICRWLAVCRPECSQAASTCCVAGGGENITFRAPADTVDEAQRTTAFDREDAKRAGVRRAFTICRTAL